MEFTNNSKLTFMIHYWISESSREQTKEVEPGKTVTIKSSTDSATLSTFFNDSDDKSNKEKLWNEFWAKHDMPKGPYELGGFRKTKYGSGKFSYMMTSDIEALLIINRDEKGVFILNTV